ncbi:glycosyltransferase family 4 protein [bacterium]|nr:glycosyltransferase family 4 protein [bacterium]
MCKKKLKIAMIGQKGIPAVYGGVERHVEEIAKRLVKKGHEVTVYSRPYYMAENKYKDTLYKGIYIKVLPTVRSKHLDAIAHCFLSSCNLIGKKYDIVHYHAIGPSTVSFIPRIFFKKTVVTIHGLDWQRQKWSFLAALFLKLGERTAFYFPHKTISVSRTLKNYYDKKYKGNIEYIPNGVNKTAAYCADIINRKYNLTANSYVVFISRLEPEKGCRYLIEAFKKIKSDKKLVIVGDSIYSKDYVKSLHKTAEDDKRIFFTGNVVGKELAELFANAYLFVLPSEIEGLPIVILEALSFGKCVLASDIPENMEVIYPPEEKGAQYGFSFKSKDVNDLSDKLKLLIYSPQKVTQMAEKAKKYVEQNFNWDIIADQTEKVYYSLLK